MMKGRHSPAVVGLATVALVIAACSTQDTAVTEPEIGIANFAKKSQENRCTKYSLVEGSYNHEEARNHAITVRGGVVASISSVEEQACITALRGSGYWYWINASDAAVEGEWRWLNSRKNGAFWIGASDGKSLGYSNWAGGNPNGGAENCAVIESNGTDAPWHDFGCNDGHGYVLKLP